jgi:hypothetical protein
MKNGIKIAVTLVLAILVGGLSMGCIDAPVKVPVINITDPAELPSEVFNGTTIVVEIVMVDIPEVVAESYILTYNPYITVLYPENIVGWDTIEERAYMYQAKLNFMVNYYEGYQGYEFKGRSEFYHRYYQGKQDKYQRMMNYVGNTILTDSEYTIERADNISGNCSA